MKLWVRVFFLFGHAACGILVLWAGIELRLLAVKELSPNHRIAREFSGYVYFKVTRTIKIICTQSKSSCCFKSHCNDISEYYNFQTLFHNWQENLKFLREYRVCCLELDLLATVFPIDTDVNPSETSELAGKSVGGWGVQIARGGAVIKRLHS